jgi:hypothetical protein
MYIVNNYGSVISFKYKKPRILKMTPDTDGYPQVVLCKKGSTTSFKVHALVGNAFIGERTGGLTFDHIDRVKTNNRADNIRLATKSEQSINKCIHKNNKLGEKNIRKVVNSGNEYYKLQITRNKKLVVDRYFSKKKYTLAEVVAERDKELLKLKD